MLYQLCLLKHNYVHEFLLFKFNSMVSPSLKLEHNINFESFMCFLPLYDFGIFY